MSRTGLFAGLLLLGLLAAGPAQSLYVLPPSKPPQPPQSPQPSCYRLGEPPDCGQFPADPDIMVIPPGEQGVVARWGAKRPPYSNERYEGQESPVRGIRVSNNLERPLPIFLRTRKEFNAFLKFAERKPGISTCEIMNGMWYRIGCRDSFNRAFIDCIWDWDKKKEQVVLYHCHGAVRECGGICPRVSTKNKTLMLLNEDEDVMVLKEPILWSPHVISAEEAQIRLRLSEWQKLLEWLDNI